MPGQSWIITTAVGTGERGFAGDGGPAARALLNGPFDVGFDHGRQSLFLRHFQPSHPAGRCAAPVSSRPRRLRAKPAIRAMAARPLARGSTSLTASRSTGRQTSTSPTATTIASAGSTAPRASITTLCRQRRRGVQRRRRAGFASGNGRAERAGVRPGAAAGCSSPMSPTTGSASSISPPGAIATFAGTGEAQHSGDGGPATAAGVFGARAVKVAADGTVYILERQGSTLRAVDPRTGDHHHRGRHRRARLQRRRRPGAGRGLRRAQGVRARPRRRPPDRRYREPRDPPHRTPRTAWSRPSPAAARAATAMAARRSAAGLGRPHGAVVGPDGAIYIGDTENHRIRKLDPARLKARAVLCQPRKSRSAATKSFGLSPCTVCPALRDRDLPAVGKTLRQTLGIVLVEHVAFGAAHDQGRAGDVGEAVGQPAPLGGCAGLRPIR